MAKAPPAAARPPTSSRQRMAAESGLAGEGSDLVVMVAIPIVVGYGAICWPGVWNVGIRAFGSIRKSSRASRENFPVPP
ncbi:hypothetical protein D9M73_219770 [compost metagenome]